MYCNAFLDESVQLLINSILLYEDGYFDCAFYSIRQAAEVVNSMLYLSQNDNEALEKWKNKEYFPMDSKLKPLLEKLCKDYKEIKTLLPDFFNYHAELIAKSHKIIHKQGFDTFYKVRCRMPEKYKFSIDDEGKFFAECLKYTVGVILIMYILLEPLSLALSDEDVTNKLNFNFLTEAIDTDYFADYLQLNDIIDRIKNSEFYKTFINQFSDKEEMLPSVYSVVREEAWDLDALAEIEMQLHLLNDFERFMFVILKSGIKVSNFYYNGGLSWYFTTIRSNFNRHKYGGEEFKNYLLSENKFNQICENVFISVVMMYGEPLYIEHNDPLSQTEIIILKTIEHQGQQELDKFNKRFDQIVERE